MLIISYVARAICVLTYLPGPRRHKFVGLASGSSPLGVPVCLALHYALVAVAMHRCVGGFGIALLR